MSNTGGFESVGSVLGKKPNVNVNNVDKNKYVSNVNGVKGYSYHPEVWNPNTPETQLPVEMMEWFEDQKNFVYYVPFVRDEGIERAREIFGWYKGEVSSKLNTPYPIKNKAKYFIWLRKRNLIPLSKGGPNGHSTY